MTVKQFSRFVNLLILNGLMLFWQAPALAQGDDVSALCRQIANKLASVDLRDCLDVNLINTGAYSVENKPLVVKEYPPLPGRTPMGRVLLLGGIHGDEYSSISVVFKWLRILEEHHSGMFHWRVAPLVNPDGLLRGKSQRMNANGVDLNRNFPTPNWHVEAVNYWVNQTYRSPRRYPGPAPLSEPESLWLFKEIESFKPDVIVSVHAPHGVVDFDGPHEAPKRLGQLHLKLLGTYPGSLGNYAGLLKGMPVLTIELDRAGIMPTRYEIRDIWGDMIRWLRKNLNKNTVYSPQADQLPEAS